jgi:signal peptidase
MCTGSNTIPALKVDPMADTPPPRDSPSLIEQFRTSDHWAVSLARDILWVVCVVGAIAIALYLICGTWPAVVTIESESMVPHLNKGDLVVVVEKDRFGDLQTWDDGKASGYKKYSDYGDVIIYRPNGYTDFWAKIGLLPFSGQHPIIHRAMTWIEPGTPVPQYLNVYRGAVTPAGYLPLAASGTTANGYTILLAGNDTGEANYTPDSRDITITSAAFGDYVIPARYVDGNTGYIRDMGTTTDHGGYITKGDNNPTSDQGSLFYANTGKIEPVEKEWVVGKAYFAIPLVGYLPLYIGPVIIIVIILMLLHEIYLRRNGEDGAETARPGKKGSKKKR